MVDAPIRRGDSAGVRREFIDQGLIKRCESNSSPPTSVRSDSPEFMGMNSSGSPVTIFPKRPSSPGSNHPGHNGSHRQIVGLTPINTQPELSPIISDPLSAKVGCDMI